MRSPKLWCVLVTFVCLAAAPLAFAQSDKPAGDAAQAKSTAKPATEDEVQQLRSEVAELKTQIQRLVQASGQKDSGDAHLVQASDVVASNAKPDDVNAPPAVTPADIDGLQKEIEVLQKKAADVPAVTAGWNGEHFFLKSSDGKFTMMPIGYLNGQYNFYKGDGAPSDTFSIRRARFGVQGNYGSQLDYAFLFETASTATPTIAVRDAYMDFKPWSAFKIRAASTRCRSPWKSEPPIPTLSSADRSIISVLYPDAGGAFRAPGVDVHGDLAGGRLQYWVGIFNGQGLLASGTTNEPEVVGRVRLAPWRNSDIHLAEGAIFRRFLSSIVDPGALSNELSFSGVLIDGTYTFFPQFRINGGVERYNGFFSWLRGPLGIRGEYTQLLQKRSNIGSLAPGGIGSTPFPA